MKVCSKCGEEKPKSDFYKESSRVSDKLCSQCKKCKKEGGARWQAANPQKVAGYKRQYSEKHLIRERNRKRLYGATHKQRQRDKHLQRTYNITYEQYDRMFTEQNGLCAICGYPERHKTPTGIIKPLSVDHDHSSGQLRNLLCADCNHGLGNLKDDPQLCLKAAHYLERHRKDR